MGKGNITGKWNEIIMKKGYRKVKSRENRRLRKPRNKGNRGKWTSMMAAGNELKIHVEIL